MLMHRDVCISLILMVLAFSFKQVLTRSMALHMLVHIPLILCSGWFMSKAGSSRQPKPASHHGGKHRYGYNEQGIPGLLAALLVSAWWMLPISLDNVLLFPAFDVLKFVSVFLVGMVLRDSILRANRVVLLFFLGNFCWMSAIVGLLYQENVSRLCNFYLLSDQEHTGRGLVILAIALPLFWLFMERDKVRHYLRH